MQHIRPNQVVEIRQFRAHDWTREIIHRPTGGEDFGSFSVHTVQQENALTESRDGCIEISTVKRTRRGCQAVQKALLILIGLELADDPGSGVRECLVIEVNRVLGREHKTNAKRAGLFQQAQDDRFTGWVCNWRQVADNFVKINQSTQAAGAGLRPHPGFDRGIEQGDEEHAFLVRKMGKIKDGVARFTVGRVEKSANVERLPLQPVLEGRSSNEIVERHGKLETVLFRVELCHRKNAQFFERRGLYLHNQGLKVQVLPLAPSIFKDI